MKLKLIILLLAFLISASIAQAQDNQAQNNAQPPEFNKQYYSMLRDTCKKNNVERAWNRWFGDKQKDLNEDTCCMESVAEMEKQKAQEAEDDGTCPDGLQKKSLDCPTSKKWCEKPVAP